LYVQAGKVSSSGHIFVEKEIMNLLNEGAGITKVWNREKCRIGFGGE
jgi:hypothetical protein